MSKCDYANEITKDFAENKPVHGVNFWLKAVKHQDCSELKMEVSHE